MEEFKFPHEKEGKPESEEIEIEIEGQEKPEIEVVDDTPPEDRGRKPSEPPKEVTDEELAKYDESVRNRIRHFTKGYHDERRAKEAAEREREEALKFAQSIIEENKKLKGSLGQSQQSLIEVAKKNAVAEVEEAKRKYKAAYESGDSDALVSAQEELTSAKMKAERLANFKPPVQEQEKDVTIPVRSEPAVQKTDEKAQAWREKNPWFGPDDEMTAFALGYHKKLVREGVDPRSDEYYQKIDSRMRQVFPDAFESEKPADATPQRTKSNVAPATRNTAPRKIVLTERQVNIAKRLGVPLELYAKKVAEEMRK
jgi:hypothetical protein